MKYYIRDNDLHSKDEKNKTLVLKKNKREVVELNELGSFIWKLLRTKKSIPSLTAKIMGKYKGAQAQEVEKDVEDFIAGCVKNSLVRQL